MIKLIPRKSIDVPDPYPSCRFLVHIDALRQDMCVLSVPDLLDSIDKRLGYTEKIL